MLLWYGDTVPLDSLPGRGRSKVAGWFAADGSPYPVGQSWVEEEPLIVERGEGAYLIDVEGRRYIDGVSSLWCNVHGHGHPRINEAVRAQLDRVAHSTMLGLSHEPHVVVYGARYTL